MMAPANDPDRTAIPSHRQPQSPSLSSALSATANRHHLWNTPRLYYDLVSLGEDISVKQEAFRAARKLYQDDQDQVDQGTLAPIELTRAQALATSSEFDLVQAQGLYRQQEVVFRNEIIRPGAPTFRAVFSSIVPTDHITVPSDLEPLNVEALEAEGLANRPDLAQALLQIKSGQISVDGSRNNALAQLNVYANGYQQQLLDAERDKLALGKSTNLLVVQKEAFLAQAKSTEIVARSNWQKARIALDRALGDLLREITFCLMMQSTGVATEWSDMRTLSP